MTIVGEDYYSIHVLMKVTKDFSAMMIIFDSQLVKFQTTVALN